MAKGFDCATPDQMQTIIEYIKGANDATPSYSTGVYGSYSVVNAVKGAGVASHVWQTYAWSHGHVEQHAGEIVQEAEKIVSRFLHNEIKVMIKALYPVMGLRAFLV